MDATAIALVSTAVVTLTQLVKWMGLPDSKGPISVIGFSALGMVLYIYSAGAYQRSDLFAYFANWLVVATSAAGVFGFTRAAASSLTSTKEPPPGAGANPTVKG